MSISQWRLSFGANLIEPGRTRFRIWAPAQRAVSIAIAGRPLLQMARGDDGWFAAEADCGAGTRYRYVLQDGTKVPDPAARAQSGDVHGESMVIDPASYQWRRQDWRGRPWREAVFYELHVGAFGGFRRVARELPRLAELGITAVELMPIAEFPGSRNWGYDGVLPFAPESSYGSPDELKALIDAAHDHGLMIFLDVVYNHFGPDGNYLHSYAPEMFRNDLDTPWGPAIDFRRKEVRRYFTDNALYWLIEYRFDGLRFDAVHAIPEPDWLDEMAAEVRRTIGPHRQIHLVLENDNNTARHLAGEFNAQWNDDGHHVLHVLLTDEREGYYADYADAPAARLARCLKGGFIYQGETSPYRGRPRGTRSADLPPTAFVLFLQNHDQIGNRAFGERLTTLADPAALEAAIALQLLCPQIPLVFMGEEAASESPFLFFTDHKPELAKAVCEGRRREFAGFAQFSDPQRLAKIPDPNAIETFERSKSVANRTVGGKRERLYKDLLAIRRAEIIPHLDGARSLDAHAIGPAAVLARWRLANGSLLVLASNFGRAPTSLPQQKQNSTVCQFRSGRSRGASWHNRGLLHRRVFRSAMNDAAVLDLARRAGIAVQWIDYANKRRRVPIDTIRRILAALGLQGDTEDDLSHSLHRLEGARPPPLITTTVGKPVDVALEVPGDARARVTYEDGNVAKLSARQSRRGVVLPGIQTIGYHTLEIGQTRVTLAVAPARCIAIESIAPGERLAGLAAQTYGLRSMGDCGIGDMAGVTALAKAAAARRVDALALSPAHALFAADPGHCSPYSPSNRLFYNPLLADAASVLGAVRAAKARVAAGLGAAAHAAESSPLIEWMVAGRAKMTVLRCLFDDFAATDLVASPTTELATDFKRFRAAHGETLEQHALFEALHGARLRVHQSWNFRDWPTEWRDPRSVAMRDFAENNQVEILFHIFLQWIADRSFAAAQQETRRAGMRIGVIADLAVGLNGGGSQAWISQDDILDGLEIGAPPDLFNAHGQNWGLTTFSPLALSSGGFAPFIATLRSCMRHAGGVRIDHAMGFMRLWVTPHGAKASDGAYLTYPLDDLFRLTALELHRHRAIVIGEDLGTVPAGFRDRLARNGIYGMNVLWFERHGKRFAPPHTWPTDAVAMTSTHDLPTVAGWWRGTDLDMRERCGVLRDPEAEYAARGRDRIALWNAFSAKSEEGNLPTVADVSRVADAAVKFIAKTPSRLALVTLEDVLALEEQPNLPGTIDEHPNWRRRYVGEAGALLDAADARFRLQALTRRDLS